MTSFSYVALGSSGDIKGTIEADDERSARQSLRAQGVRVLSLAAGGHQAEGLLGQVGRFLHALLPRNYLPVRSIDQVQFFRQGALMLRSGHTAIETLEATSKLSAKASMTAALSNVARTVEKGSSLSAALAHEKGAFNPFMVRLIEAGEAGGELDQVMTQLADDTERKVELKRQVIAALTYPSVVVLMSVGVVAFLIGGVIPKFASFLTAKGKELPWAAADLMAIASFITTWGPLIGLILLLAVVAILVAQTKEQGRRVTGRVVLALPVIGPIAVASGIAQLAWTLSMLINSGLSVMDSLQSAGAASRNGALRAGLETAAQRVLEGQRLSAAFEQAVFPPMLQHMAAVGEKSGELVAVMDQVGAFYRKELEARIKIMTALIEPALIIFVGGIVGFVYFAFFQALFSVGAA